MNIRRNLCTLIGSRWKSFFYWLDCKRYANAVDTPPEISPDIPEPVLPPVPPIPKPKKKMHICKNTVADTGYIVGYVPGDLSSLVSPFKGGHFNYKDWDNSADLMAKFGVNATRFFLTCTEDPWTLHNYFIPFKKQAPNTYVYDLTEFDPDMIEGLICRLESFWERKITTVICIVTGLKSARWQFTTWHGSRNVNGTTTTLKMFMQDKKTVGVFDDVLKKLVKTFDNECVIWELINEPTGQVFGDVPLANWCRGRMEKLHKLGVPYERIAFEKWDSSQIIGLLENEPWMFWHGVNHLGSFQRYLKPGTEMKDEFYDKHPRICADSDGADSDFPGRGLKGARWGDVLRRASSWDMNRGLKYDHAHGGMGWMIMSAAAWLGLGNYPDYDTWADIAVNGLTEKQCKKLGVEYKYNKQSELRAVDNAVKEIFK